jgi:hypothetical protein
MAKNQELLEIIDLVADTMHEASHYNLHVEVIASAMKALKDNPGMGIQEAINFGLKEWDL